MMEHAVKESHETSIKIRKPVVGKVERFDPKPLPQMPNGC